MVWPDTIYFETLYNFTLNIFQDFVFTCTIIFNKILSLCRTGVQTFRREHDRFWVMAAHPSLNLFAAGILYCYVLSIHIFIV